MTLVYVYQGSKYWCWCHCCSEAASAPALLQRWWPLRSPMTRRQSGWNALSWSSRNPRHECRARLRRHVPHGAAVPQQEGACDLLPPHQIQVGAAILSPSPSYYIRAVWIIHVTRWSWV
jgi:hypothetical protein